ncbi:MAG: hypothetical protein A2V69_01840 [Candidatus Portnoybacteria bacterium RBG_13_40_8]|uniref:Type II secretion system protein GspG C-terminal domain-containing protein n=1 Tax=Candidatus Portnoybacteria bacterium RBG_13_40_8 TaxID=1801990 RepID=A0A1G2F543_9BACT|nr:MAG: hypothetical protein A2V69_01840 [Candidatus Portnoybacteria bacterium RBG_13_40_8]
MKKGFTLIELLIVIAIIGILASIIIPNATNAIQKAKQKATMSDMVTITTACASYAMGSGRMPKQEGEVEPDSEFMQAIAPYISAFQPNDKWGHKYLIYTGSAIAGQYGIEEDDLTGEDFLIISLGRDGQMENFLYDPKNPDSGFFSGENIESLKNDLIRLNNSWIRAPISATK